MIGPYYTNGEGIRPVQLHEPLDFAAVTDHAETIGEVYLCTTPGSEAYDSENCRSFRGDSPERERGFAAGIRRMMSLGGTGDRNAELCGPENRTCRDALKTAWDQNREITERFYDRTGACSFTTFHGYEYSNSVSLSKVHRNIIFRNASVPESPVSSLEQPDPVGLWEDIESLCQEASGNCDAVSIPHNPNASNGRMFTPMYREETIAEQQRQAALRARMEPVVEMMQVKGESECKAGMWNVLGEDEACGFEKIFGTGADAPGDCEDDYGSGALAGFGCQSRLDFARYAVIAGMVEEQRIGINPYRFGFIGGTDTHNATPGAAREDDYAGCCAEVDTSPEARLQGGQGFARKPMRARNPGGLMGVWAEENSRDALFDAIQRREVFATSGPRIRPRFFAGHDLGESACETDMAEQGYANGVAMGSVLGPAESGKSPVFTAAVQADPEGGLLQRLQVIKVWAEGEETFHQAVHDIAGSANNGARVDLSDCSVSGPGDTQLCASWRDPDFIPQQPAAYYLRVIENPSCRWTWHDCLAIPEASRPAACSDPDLPRTIQERAWTSPIWYSPGTSSANNET